MDKLKFVGLLINVIEIMLQGKYVKISEIFWSIVFGKYFSEMNMTMCVLKSEEKQGKPYEICIFVNHYKYLGMSLIM